MLTLGTTRLGSIVVIPTAESVGLRSVCEFLRAIPESYVQGVLLMNYESSVPEDLIFCSVFCTKLLTWQE